MGIDYKYQAVIFVEYNKTIILTIKKNNNDHNSFDIYQYSN